MSGAFPEVARNGVALRPVGQGRAEADLAFADGDRAAASSAFERCIQRLEAVVDQETAALKGRTATDLREFNNRKSQGLLELSRSLKYFQIAPPTNAVQSVRIAVRSVRRPAQSYGGASWAWMRGTRSRSAMWMPTKRPIGDEIRASISWHERQYVAMPASISGAATRTKPRRKPIGLARCSIQSRPAAVLAMSSGLPPIER